MSIEFSQCASIATDEVEIPDDPEDVFDDVIANASLCCQQCYRRLRARHRFPDRPGFDYSGLLTFVDVELPPGADWEILGTEYYTTEPIDDRLEEMHPPDGPNDSSHGCSFCGAVKPHRSRSTRSREGALQSAIGVSVTLQELGVAHNPLALLVEVGELKRDPNYAGDDAGTFATATERAIRAGRRPR